jgi:hypothetical protein
MSIGLGIALLLFGLILLLGTELRRSTHVIERHHEAV